MSVKRAFFGIFQKLTLFCCAIFFGFANAFSANLPAGYTELEYIQSSGSQYIDTGIKPDSNFSYEIKFSGYTVPTSGSAEHIMFGETAAGWNDMIGINQSRAGSRSNVIPYIKYDGVACSLAQQTNGILKLTPAGLYFNGDLVYSKTPSSFGTETYSIYLFAANRQGTASYFTQYRLENFKVWNNDVLVGNFIPAKDSNNVVGMYDTVSGQFFTNAGTGTFIAGPEVSIRIATTAYNAARFSPVQTDLNSAVATIREIVTKTINQTAAIASLQADKQTRPEDACPAGKKCLLVETEENGVIVPHWFPIIENIYGLPAGYTPLEYIQSRSSPAEAYIDTGLNFNSNYMYEITYAKGGLQNVFMGARGTTDYLAKGNFSLTYNSSSCVYSSTSTNSTPVNFDDTTFGVKHTVKYQQSTSTLLFDDTNKWDSNWITNIEIPYHVYLFAFNQGGTPGGARMEYARIYAYSVKNSNGIFIQNFVPAKNSSGVIGMYDTVNDRFYTNAGTGTFTAGPEM